MDEDETEANLISINSQISNYIPIPQNIELVATSICGLLGLDSFEVSISLVSPEEIKGLNKEYRSKNSSTDVLSFPQHEFEQKPTIANPYLKSTDNYPHLLGDVIICPMVAEENAKKIGQSLSREICFLIVHGILHLTGHNHIESEEEKMMIEQQNMIMATLNQNHSNQIQNLIHIPEVL